MAASSLAEVVNLLEEELFVGREPELQVFRTWLHGDREFPDVMNVSGPSGIGKSALLRSFQRIARHEGRAAVLVDGSGLPATVRGLLSALQGSATDDLDDVVARLNGTRALILLDSFDQPTDLTEFVRAELLPRLGTNARVVIAGRSALGLAWGGNHSWHRLIRPLRLGGFTLAESRQYLHRRGVDDAHVVDQIIRAAGTSPLALSLAAELSVRFAVGDFGGAAAEWRLVVRSLLERRLVEVTDRQLRELIEACSAVRQFDEATLAAITGQNEISAGFARLCRLSIVTPTAHGLMLHDDLRRWLADDLAWRNPERYHALRTRALAFCRERLRSAPRNEGDWLVADCLFLWGNALIQQLFFCPDEPGEVIVQPGRLADHAEIRQLAIDSGRDLPAEVDLARLVRPQEDEAFLTAILQCQGTRLQVARGRDGRLLGFSTVLRVCRETMSILEKHPAYASLLGAYWSQEKLAALPVAPDDGNAFVLLHMLYAKEVAPQTRAALLRDLAGLFARGGIHFCTTFVPAYKRMLETCGYDLLPAARNEAWGAAYPVDGYVLDLSKSGVEPWLDAVMHGRRPPRPLDRAELETELQQVFRHWKDDSRLARSRLTELAGASPVDADGRRAQAVREKILQAIADSRAEASDGLDGGYRALELTYLGRQASHKGGARTLAVSRATLYRLLKRAIHGLAETLALSSASIPEA